MILLTAVKDLVEFIMENDVHDEFKYHRQRVPEPDNVYACDKYRYFKKRPKFKGVVVVADGKRSMEFNEVLYNVEQAVHVSDIRGCSQPELENTAQELVEFITDNSIGDKAKRRAECCGTVISFKRHRSIRFNSLFGKVEREVNAINLKKYGPPKPKEVITKVEPPVHKREVSHTNQTAIAAQTEERTHNKEAYKMKITDNKGAPPELIRIVDTACKKHPVVEHVIFDAFVEELKGNTGAFNPDTRTIYIDMGACINDRTWMRKGIMYSANVWFNLVYSFFHELEHAQQLERDPTLKELSSLPEKYEKEADDAGMTSALKWAFKNNMPTLNEMGWVGEQIKQLFNRLYAKIPNAVDEELDLQGTDLVARAATAASRSKGYSTEEETATLLDDVGKGFMGGMLNGKKYLTAYEALDLDCTANDNQEE